jgi:GAF domain-containing protein
VAAGPTLILQLSKAAFDDIQRQSSPAGNSVLFAMIRTSSERIRWLSAQVIVYDEVGKAIGEARDLQTLLDVILQQLVAATSADWGLLLLRSQFNERLEIRGQANLSLTEPQREGVSNGQGFLAPILRDPQDHLSSFLQEEEPFKSCAPLGFETPSLLTSPITLEGQTLGLILLGGRERDQFNLNQLNLMRGVARQAAQAILNARHREEQEARSRHSRQFVRF